MYLNLHAVTDLKKPL